MTGETLFSERITSVESMERLGLRTLGKQERFFFFFFFFFLFFFFYYTVYKTHYLNYLQSYLHFFALHLSVTRFAKYVT